MTRPSPLSLLGLRHFGIALYIVAWCYFGVSVARFLAGGGL